MFRTGRVVWLNVLSIRVAPLYESRFDSPALLEVWVKTWRFAAVTATSLRRLPDGRVMPHCDPAIMQQFLLHPHDHETMTPGTAWGHYDAQNIPARCLGGVNRDLVSCVTTLASAVRPWPLAESASLTPPTR